MEPITLTESCTNKLVDLLAEENNPNLKLRVFVAGGGCSGFNYVFDFAQEKLDDDFEFGQVLVDSLSMQYLAGATVDYIEDIMGSSFNIENPNAQTTCGCGSSFSV